MRAGRGKPSCAGQRERLLGVPDAGLGLSLEGLGASELGERTDELGAGRQRLEQGHRLCGQLRPARIPSAVEHLRERAHRAGSSQPVASLPEGRDRLLQRLRGVGEASGVERGLAEAGERHGPVGMSGRGERERPLEARERGSRVQSERALRRQAEEAQRGCFELARLLALPGGAGELEGSRVVVGEHVGQVLDPVGSLRLDPGGCCDMAGGA